MNLGKETETLEFKRSTGELKEAVISIAAILNKHRKGELYFGVGPDGAPVGQDVSEKTLRAVSQAISNHIEPQIFPEISTVMIDDRECILVRFEGYNTPYFAYNIARIRVADEDKTMSQPEIVKYLQRKNGIEDAWERKLSDTTISVVLEKNVRDYMKRSKAAGRIGFEFTDKTSALNKLGLTNGEYLLNAGVVLFSNSTYAELQMAVFAGTERLTFLDIQRKHGTVFELVALAEKYIVSNIHWQVVFDGSLRRKEIPEIPIDAIREALINSFCHKDYGACQSNEVAIYKDRVEIYNPGTFPSGFSPADFIRGNERPVRRNPLITSILYYSKDVESFGTGLKRIATACRDVNCRFDFKILKSGFLVVFYRSVQSTGNNARSMGQGYTIQDDSQDFAQDSVVQYDVRGTIQDNTIQDDVQGTVQDSTVQEYNIQDDADIAQDSVVQYDVRGIIQDNTIQDGAPGTVQGYTIQDDVRGTVQDSTVQEYNIQDDADIAQDSVVQYDVRDTIQDNTIQDGAPGTVQDNVQVDSSNAETIKKKIWMYCSQPRSRDELMQFCRFKNRAYFTTKYMQPMLQSGQIMMTLPDKPNSKNQKYVRAESFSDRRTLKTGSRKARNFGKIRSYHQKTV